MVAEGQSSAHWRFRPAQASVSDTLSECHHSLAKCQCAGLGSLSPDVLQELQILPRHLEHVPVFAERVPDLGIVSDHLGKPPLMAVET